uniref:Transposase n=1 Tax=Cereibacter sphaeroides (strain ATCC 17025 / ATH 2.4.3) TaxID=349102 RepID=A4WQI1_CERS5
MSGKTGARPASSFKSLKMARLETLRPPRLWSTACAPSCFPARWRPLGQRHGRRTARLQVLVQYLDLGLTLGGRPGQALAHRRLLPVSKYTLLRSVKNGLALEAPPARVVGIDDWAWKKGHRYGSILCDLERLQGDRPFARPRAGHRRGLAGRASERRDRLPRPRRQVWTGRRQGSTQGPPGSRLLEPA